MKHQPSFIRVGWVFFGGGGKEGFVLSSFGIFFSSSFKGELT